MPCSAKKARRAERRAEREFERLLAKNAMKVPQRPEYTSTYEISGDPPRLQRRRELFMGAAVK